jgi:hypothetical protein
MIEFAVASMHGGGSDDVHLRLDAVEMCSSCLRPFGCEMMLCV